MNKSILISIKPKYVANILNGEKTIEIRKKFPKDYVGWVYIYCTKNGALLFKEHSTNTYFAEEENKNYRPNYALNGKVVARFWCDKVEEIDRLSPNKINLKGTCISYIEYCKYIGDKNGYAIHITKLETFDTLKEISEFNHYTTKRDTVKGIIHDYEELTYAPQSWCYVEEN